MATAKRKKQAIAKRKKAKQAKAPKQAALDLSPLNTDSASYPATMRGKTAALEALRKRRANQPKRIDNSSLYAGSPMYYYCKSCGHLADCLPESHWGPPAQLCGECEALKDLGWLEE
jgi:hypothetical protein